MAIDLADGRPWVLLPGTLCNGAVFDGLLDALGVPLTARHVVPLAWPKVGDYVDAVQRVCTPEAVICGFSLGAIVAAHLADRLDVTAMLLFGLNPHADDPAKRVGRLALERDIQAVGGAAALGARLAPLAGPDPAQARRLILTMAEDSAVNITAQTALALTRPGALGALARANLPVCLLTGTMDDQAPLVLAQEAANAAPKAMVVPLPGLGHYALVEDPAVCCKALLEMC